MSQTPELKIENGVLLNVTPSNIDELTLPEGIHTIGKRAASYSHVKSVTLPVGVTTIEESAFSHCSYLEKISLPEGLLTIGDSAFSHAPLDKAFTLPESVKTIGAWAFQYARFREITLPRSLETVDDNAFRDCSDAAFTIDCAASLNPEIYKKAKEITPFAMENGHVNIWTAVGNQAENAVRHAIGFYSSGKHIFLKKQPISYPVALALVNAAGVSLSRAVLKDGKIIGTSEIQTVYYDGGRDHADYKIFSPINR